MGQVRSVMTSLLRSIAMAISTCRRGRSTAAACSVRHFSPAEDDKTGLLVHRRAAPSMGGGCLITMSRVTTTTRLAFCSDTMPGEYVSIRDAKGTMHTFMVKSVISVSP